MANIKIHFEKKILMQHQMERDDTSYILTHVKTFFYQDAELAHDGSWIFELANNRNIVQSR